MLRQEKNITIEDGTFTSEMDGKSHIYFRHYFPKSKDGHPRLHIIFQHGMIEYFKRHEELYFALIEHFNGEIIISVMDLIGHGRSGGHRAYVDEFKDYTRDWLKFLNLCHMRLSEYDRLETFVISHSLGGLIVLSTLANDENILPMKIKATIFVNPCISPKLKLPAHLENKLENMNFFISKIRVPLIYDAYDLTHDNERAKAFIKDPLISKAITLKLAAETLKATKNITRHSYFYKYDSLFILSGDDRVVDNEKTRLFVTGMDKNKVKVREYPNMCHDILNETCRNDVFADIINYIELKRSK